jgi:RNA polymerase sigma-70 factor (ECF subfamily)
MNEDRERAMRSLERWVTVYQPVVFRAAYLILRDPASAEDVAQETFLRAFRAAHKADPGEGVRAWLYRIAVNTALNEVRRRKRETAALDRARTVDRNDDPTDTSDTMSVVAAAIDRLPERLRIAVICRYFLDLSETEMASVLSIRPGTVKSRLHEARRLLAGDESMSVAAGASGV